MAKLRADRVRMDNYRAYFAMHIEGSDQWWWANPPEIFYRKGMAFRRDFALRGKPKLAANERPGPGAGSAQWWREHAKSLTYYPVCVMRDTTTYVSNLQPGTDPDGTQYQTIASVHHWESDLQPGELYPPEWSMRPEFACRPPLGIGNAHIDPTLDMHPADGPPGSIKLSVRETPTKGAANAKPGQSYDAWRYSA